MAMEPPSEHKQTQTETVNINGSLSKARLSLTTEAGTRGGQLMWHFISNHAGPRRKKCLDFDIDVLGYEIRDKRIVVRAFELIQKESCSSCLTERNRFRKDYVFEMETEETANFWGRLIRECMDSLGRPRNLFVIVNPFGGTKTGPNIFENEVKPLLRAAAINFEMQVVNGLLKREDWDKAIKMPLGIIPGGTGNGMVKSLLHAAGDQYSVCNATFTIIKGHTCSLDVASIVQGKKMFFSVLFLAWGLVADINIESEKLRWLGSARLEIYSLLRIFDLRRYNGKIRFVPASGYEDYGHPIQEHDALKGETFVSALASPNGAGPELKSYRCVSTESEGSKWRFIDGPFVTVWVQNVPWASKDAMPAPRAKFSDGCLDLIIVRDCPKTALLSLMLSIRDGTHVNSPIVTYLKVKELMFEAGTRVGEMAMRGIIDMDGEVIARGDDAINFKDPNLMDYASPFVMKVDQGLATFFCPT